MSNMQKKMKSLRLLVPLLAVGLAGCATVEKGLAEAVAATKRASLTGAERATGAYYIQVNTSEYPNGAIRGQFY